MILPTPLLEVTLGNREITIEASSVRELLEKLENLYPGLMDKICDEQGAFRRYVNIFINEEHVPHDRAHKASLKGNDTVYILPSIAGGI